MIELLSRLVSLGARCISLCLAAQETGITSGPVLGSGRQQGVNSPNDDQLVNGPMQQGRGVRLASCSSGEGNLKMGTFMICEVVN